jgi:hypothetical protein
MQDSGSSLQEIDYFPARESTFASELCKQTGIKTRGHLYLFMNNHLESKNRHLCVKNLRNS